MVHCERLCSLLAAFIREGSASPTWFSRASLTRSCGCSGFPVCRLAHTLSAGSRGKRMGSGRSGRSSTTREMGLFAISMTLVALVGISVARGANSLFMAIILSASVATAFSRWLFPRDPFFSLTFANPIAVYTSIFAFFMEEVFGVRSGPPYRDQMFFFLLAATCGHYVRRRSPRYSQQPGPVWSSRLAGPCISGRCGGFCIVFVCRASSEHQPSLYRRDAGNRPDRAYRQPKRRHLSGRRRSNALMNSFSACPGWLYPPLRS